VVLVGPVALPARRATMHDEKPESRDEPDDGLGLAEAAEQEDGPDALKRAMKGGGSPLSGLGLLSLGMLPPPTKPTARSLNSAMGSLWLDLEEYDREHPSDRVRLAAHLIRAAELLLSEGEDGASKPVARGRALLANGAKKYIEARGEAWWGIKLNGSITLARWGFGNIVRIVRSGISKKFPGQDIDTETFSTVVAAAIITIWEHKHFESVRRLMKQKGGVALLRPEG
jgi:hypothetical protein